MCYLLASSNNQVSQLGVHSVFQRINRRLQMLDQATRLLPQNFVIQMSICLTYDIACIKARAVQAET